MWYSPQRTLTHGTSTAQTHTAHVVQSAADSHAWDKYHMGQDPQTLSTDTYPLLAADDFENACPA